MLTVVFSKHRSRWWCCISKMSSFVSLSSLPLAARAAILASAAFFLETKAAPEVALAICIRASRAFWNSNQKSLVRIIKAILYDIYFDMIQTQNYHTNTKKMTKIFDRISIRLHLISECHIMCLKRSSFAKWVGLLKLCNSSMQFRPILQKLSCWNLYSY